MPTNKPYRVKVKITPNKHNVDLIVLLTHAGVLERCSFGSGAGTYYLHPPKGTTDNKWWAEHLYSHCRHLFDIEVVILGGTATR